MRLVSCDRIGAVGDVLEADGPFDVLVAGPSLGTRSGLVRLHLIADELPHMRVVLAFSRRPDAPLRDIVRTGAVDLVQLPAADSALLASVERACRLAAGAATGAVDPAPSPLTGRPLVSTLPGVDPMGAVYAVASPTRGSGKTFYATNLAWYLQRWTDERVCIVDLDLPGAGVAASFGMRPTRTIADALDRRVDECLTVHESGLHVLAAPADPTDAARVGPSEIGRILAAVRRRFDHVVVDTPAALTDDALGVFDAALVFCLATPDLASATALRTFLATLGHLGIGPGDLRLVLNRADPNIDSNDRNNSGDGAPVRDLFEQKFESVLPHSTDVARSARLGLPVLAAAPGAEISSLLAETMLPILPAASHVRAATASTRPLGRLGRRLFASRANAPT